jgi:maleate cis-trans isomerase
MATVTTIERQQADSSLPAPRARIGMIIPSVNSMTEPQFNHFAPPGLGVHVARARLDAAPQHRLVAVDDRLAEQQTPLSAPRRSPRLVLMATRC